MSTKIENQVETTKNASDNEGDVMSIELAKQAAEQAAKQEQLTEAAKTAEIEAKQRIAKINQRRKERDTVVKGSLSTEQRETLSEYLQEMMHIDELAFVGLWQSSHDGKNFTYDGVYDSFVGEFTPAIRDENGQQVTDENGKPVVGETVDFSTWEPSLFVEGVFETFQDILALRLQRDLSNYIRFHNGKELIQDAWAEFTDNNGLPERLRKPNLGRLKKTAVKLVY